MQSMRRYGGSTNSHRDDGPTPLPPSMSSTINPLSSCPACRGRHRAHTCEKRTARAVDKPSKRKKPSGGAFVFVRLVSHQRSFMQVAGSSEWAWTPHNDTYTIEGAGGVTRSCPLEEARAFRLEAAAGEPGWQCANAQCSDRHRLWSQQRMLVCVCGAAMPATATAFEAATVSASVRAEVVANVSAVYSGGGADGAAASAGPSSMGAPISSDFAVAEVTPLPTVGLAAAAAALAAGAPVETAAVPVQVTADAPVETEAVPVETSADAPVEAVAVETTADAPAQAADVLAEEVPTAAIGEAPDTGAAALGSAAAPVVAVLESAVE